MSGRDTGGQAPPLGTDGHTDDCLRCVIQYSRRERDLIGQREDRDFYCETHRAEIDAANARQKR